MKISPPAFPTYLAENMAHGMGLRDYFAAAALPPIIQNWYENGDLPGDEDNSYWIAFFAYKIADSMMKVREE